MTLQPHPGKEDLCDVLHETLAFKNLIVVVLVE